MSTERQQPIDRQSLPLLSPPENTKLGPGIHSWALPAGRHATCPGESNLCRAHCYAKKGHYHHRAVQAAYERNFAFAQTPEFVPWMHSALRTFGVRILRVHSSGDFHDLTYIRRWCEIATAARSVLFFAYTRSWRDESLFPELLRLTRLSNFSLWWSTDRETGPAPAIRGVRQAYMAVDDLDAQLAPDDCDLVFRVRRDSVMPRANGVPVCPPENGIKPRYKITCTTCGICWRKRALSRIEKTILPYLHWNGQELTVPGVT